MGKKGGSKSLGNALRNRGRNGGNSNEGVQSKHTTDFHPEVEKPNLQSVIERNDLDELMAMADLQGRDFTAERRDVVVITNEHHDPEDDKARVQAALDAAKEHGDKMKVPRRPAWDRSMTPEELDENERMAFLDWRRELALVEEDGRLSVTPFEKNLEVWRQLWRVLERSDMLIQVVDSRDPLMYLCSDLEEYALETKKTKKTVLLLNKSDLLTPEMRILWADYFDSVGIMYMFWSAMDVTNAEAEEEEGGGLEEAGGRGGEGDSEDDEEENDENDGWEEAEEDDPDLVGAEDPRIRMYDRTSLIEKLEEMALGFVTSDGSPDPRAQDPPRKLMVGLVGYPNVGKSSSINALRGEKKTVVSSTPGKTKHFQTLIVAEGLMLCDCPGLVFPSIGGGSRAEMVAAAVLPIDRLTDIRSPIDVVTKRIPRAELEAIYGLRLPAPRGVGEDATRPPKAEELLRAYSIMRGYALRTGVPDEMKSGREIMRDYVSGKLLYCRMPPGSAARGLPEGVTLTTMPGASGEIVEKAGVRLAAEAKRREEAAAPGAEGGRFEGGGGLGGVGAMHTHTTLVGGGTVHGTVTYAAGTAGSAVRSAQAYKAEKEGKRASHKFQKKPKREKGRRGQLEDDGEYGGIVYGKKGGINRFAGSGEA